MPNPKKTAEHHRAMGNFRPGRHASPTLPVEAPQMPGDLSPAASACWKVMIEQLRFSGTIARVDGMAMRLLCESYGRYMDACDCLAEKGLVVEEATKFGKRIKANPAEPIRAKAWREVVSLCQQFGLTPSSRMGLVPGSSPTDESEEEKVAKILKIG